MEIPIGAVSGRVRAVEGIVFGAMGNVSAMPIAAGASTNALKSVDCPGCHEDPVKPIEASAPKDVPVVHRAAGLRVVCLIVSPEPRRQRLTLLQRWRAWGEAARTLCYNAGLTPTRPAISTHSYVENPESCAAVWGTALMAATGALLWDTNWLPARLPKVWLDFVATPHSYEAILATLAIAVWHVCGVIFDPDVSLIDAAWLTGHSGRPCHRSSPNTESNPDESRIIEK